MFTKRGKAVEMPLVSPDRVRLIANVCPPAEYIAVGKSAKRSSRQSVYKQAVIVLSQGEMVPVVIRNLSHTGCRIEYFKQVRPSGRLHLIEQSLPLEVSATVAWNGEGACGLAFEDNEQLLEKMPNLHAQPEVELAISTPRIRDPKKSRLSIRKR